MQVESESCGKLWVHKRKYNLTNRYCEGRQDHCGTQTIDHGQWGTRPMPDLSNGNYPTNYPGRIPLELQTLCGQPLRP